MLKNHKGTTLEYNSKTEVKSSNTLEEREVYNLERSETDLSSGGISERFQGEIRRNCTCESKTKIWRGGDPLSYSAFMCWYFITLPAGPVCSAAQLMIIIDRQLCVVPTPQGEMSQIPHD